MNSIFEKVDTKIENKIDDSPTPKKYGRRLVVWAVTFSTAALMASGALYYFNSTREKVGERIGNPGPTAGTEVASNDPPVDITTGENTVTESNDSNKESSAEIPIESNSLEENSKVEVQNPVEKPAIEESSTKEPPKSESPVVKESTTSVEPEKSNTETPSVVVEQPTTPAEPVNPPTATPVEPTVVWDLFNPLDENEIRPIIDKIIKQLSKDSYTYTKVTFEMVNDVQKLFNGVKIEDKYKTRDAINFLIKMLETTTCYNEIHYYIDKGRPSNNRIIISFEELVANKEEKDFLANYLQSFQPIYDALYNAGTTDVEKGLVYSELAKFTDHYYRVLIGEEKVLGQYMLKDLPIWMQTLIISNFQHMNGNLHYAEISNLLNQYNIKPQYDFRTKLDISNKLLNTLSLELEKRGIEGISFLDEEIILANNYNEVAKTKSNPIQYIKT